MRGVSGFYAYAIFEHLEGWPALRICEARIAFKLQPKMYEKNIQSHTPSVPYQIWIETCFKEKTDKVFDDGSHLNNNTYLGTSQKRIFHTFIRVRESKIYFFLLFIFQ